MGTIREQGFNFPEIPQWIKTYKADSRAIVFEVFVDSEDGGKIINRFVNVRKCDGTFFKIHLPDIKIAF